MIIVSELGDKTFLVAALMAMKHDRLVVFAGAFAALVVMSVLSGLVGHSMPALLPEYVTKLAACGLFLVFGAKLCYEGYNMPKDASVKEEMAEVEHEIQDGTLEDGETQSRRFESITNLLGLVFSPVFVQTFTLTFLGEWGDRSQIATIAMAAGSDYWWVILGTVLGHSLCTLLAVVGGRMLASQISVRSVTLGGGSLFLLFGLLYLYEVLLLALVALVLSIISAPITRFSSLGSANNVKFGVFGYCAPTGCSDIQIGYAPDQVLASLAGALSRRQRPPSPFNLPSGTRSSLSNVLIVHVVAGGLTLIMLVLSLIGHRSEAAHSSAFQTTNVILSFTTALVTLLAFLVDLLIFIPNLDWGTYVTLAAMLLNAIASIVLCAGRRRLTTRQAMRARIAENQDNFFVEQVSQPEKSTGTLPRFAQFEESPTYKVSTEASSVEHGIALSEPLLQPPRAAHPNTFARQQQEAHPMATEPQPDFVRYGNPPSESVPMASLPSHAANGLTPRTMQPQAYYGELPTRQEPAGGRRQRVVSGPRPMPHHAEQKLPYGQWEGESQEVDMQQPMPPQSPSQLSNSSHFTSVSQRGINPRWQSQPTGMGPDMQGAHRLAAPRQRRPEPPSVLAGNPDFELFGPRKSSRLPRRNMAAIGRMEG